MAESTPPDSPESSPPPSTADAATPAGPSFGTRVRQFFVTLGVAAVAAFSGAGFVAVRDAGLRSDLETAVTEAEGECEARLASIVTARDAAQLQVARFQAYLSLGRAREQLVQGNFGNARTRVQTAGRFLANAGDPALAQRVAGLDIQVTEDLATTQAQLADLERAILASVDQVDPGLE